ncbi:hypothetical protein [Rhodococcus erythropolis]|uniref:hypothetical protein n=1 Tax=Rhodococcus erythropolis TaxID=1833 RepID=UPI00203526D5|nr:hypothetical protein [Rhodococcus erythropolis]
MKPFTDLVEINPSTLICDRPSFTYDHSSKITRALHTERCHPGGQRADIHRFRAVVEDRIEEGLPDRPILALISDAQSKQGIDERCGHLDGCSGKLLRS